jgi:hypothetical protein
MKHRLHRLDLNRRAQEDTQGLYSQLFPLPSVYSKVYKLPKEKSRQLPGLFKNVLYETLTALLGHQ